MQLAEAHNQIRDRAVKLAGKPDDLVQRATNYIELYRHSDGNHGFPLLAAHGALWGAGHFRRGRRIGMALARLRRFDAEERKRQLAKIEGFSRALKEINRQVFVETYTAYHLTDRFGEDPDLADHIPAELILTLCRCHETRRSGKRLPANDRRALFEAFFLWEQANIVGPSVEAAVADLDWRLLRQLSLRPPIGFAYFRPYEWLWFKAFDDESERLRRGIQAFDRAERCGWDHVETSLASYGLLPVDVVPRRKHRCLACLQPGTPTQ